MLVDSVGQPRHWLSQPTDWLAVAPESVAPESAATVPTVAVVRALAEFVLAGFGAGESEQADFEVAAVGSVVAGLDYPKMETIKLEVQPGQRNLREEGLHAVLVHATPLVAWLPLVVSGLIGYHGFPVGLCRLSFAPTLEASTLEAYCTDCVSRE